MSRWCRGASAAWLCAVLLGAFVPGASAESKIIAEQEVEGWSLLVIANDTNDYASCSIDRNGSEPFLLSVMVERPSRLRFLTLSSLDEEKPFKTGRAYALTYSIDEGAEVAASARAIGERTVAIPFDEDLTEALRHGSQIAFLARQGGAVTFSLSGSIRALEALQDCVSRYLGFELETAVLQAPSGSKDAVSSDPFSPPNPVRASSGAGATASLSEKLEGISRTASSLIAEAMLVGDLLIREAHLADYSEILDEQSAGRIDGYDVTWRVPKARIGFSVVNSESSVDAIFGEMLSALQMACANRAQIERPDRIAAGILGRLRVYCGDAPPGLFTLFNRPRGGMYLMTVKGDPGSQGRMAAERYDDQISHAFIERVNP